ncbi:beta-L-arabinofuranosidase domain-containing protein [Ruficoccus sp. ZRK36]|uniref:beta-L-arabinofuranosidase domain-containing protein n=1 Tax=Ruficoccus sp. ZRK36 TaxID=2866311 RepID=UPI001C734A56|nr:beta-L-arabinofuranosidase domain-containing protein [Ruficoccus sp. ZRK36]QYY37464.1 glycoside hydrolase family 127 protein [Ruficoccus sp. ZRK36]
MKVSSHSETLPPSLGRLRLSGPVAEHLETFAYERIISERAHRVVFHEAEDAFRNKLDDSSGVHGIWQGEYWGKWMIGAVRHCEYVHDTELKEFIRTSVHTLMEMQEPSGYIGTYRDPMNIFPADPAVTEKALGWPCNWNWNIWCRKYTLWGLLEAYRLLGESEILHAAERLAMHLITSLKENGIRLGQTGTFAGVASGSILKPMLLLYRQTGDERYLEFSQEIVADWRREDDLCPNLITNALSGKPVHEWYGNPHDFAKAYEMMSCFEGVIELYRITRERELLESVICFHRLLKEHEYNVVHSVGFNDIFHHGSSQISAITEPCDVIHWMRLNGELYLETGDSVYLDDFELAFYNPFLASVCRDGKWGARGVRSHTRHLYVFEQAKMKHNHCCVDNMPRGFLNFAQMATTVNDNGVSVNFYSPFESELELPSGGSIKLCVSGDYLGTGKVQITWDAKLDKPIVLRLRIPGWAMSATLEIEGALETERTTPTGEGEWFDLAVESGQSSAELCFERELVVREHAATPDVPAWHRKRWIEPGIESLMRTERGSTLQYGPLLLARSRFIGNTEEEMFGPPLSAGFTCTLTPIAPNGVDYAFEAEIHDGSRSLQTKVCDFASAGNVITEEAKLFSVFF